MVKYFVLTMLMVLTGCTSTRNMPINFYDVSKLAVPAPQESYIYFMRPSAFMYGLNTPEILIDGKKVGGLANGSYFVQKVEPGKHQVFSDWGGGKGRNLEVFAIAGERGYVETECQYTGASGSVVYYGCLLVAVPEIRALRILPNLALAR